LPYLRPKGRRYRFAGVQSPNTPQMEMNRMNKQLEMFKAPTTVVHFKKYPYDVYIGRPSKWGNPFSHKEDTIAQFKVSNREEAISKYREWIKTQPKLIQEVKTELSGKVLGCWCKPKKCHGDVLAEIANSQMD